MNETPNVVPVGGKTLVTLFRVYKKQDDSEICAYRGVASEGEGQDVLGWARVSLRSYML